MCVNFIIDLSSIQISHCNICTIKLNNISDMSRYHMFPNTHLSYCWFGLLVKQWFAMPVTWFRIRNLTRSFYLFLIWIVQKADLREFYYRFVKHENIPLQCLHDKIKYQWHVKISYVPDLHIYIKPTQNSLLSWSSGKAVICYAADFSSKPIYFHFFNVWIEQKADIWRNLL